MCGVCICSLLFMVPERIFEDHENLVENLLNWTRDSHNKLMFTERIEKYALFKNPQVTDRLFKLGLAGRVAALRRTQTPLFMHTERTAQSTEVCFV